MAILTVTFDAQSFSRNAFDRIVQNGVVEHTSGLLNLLWEDFSALDAARELGLPPVTWEVTRDSTPGTLTCRVRYPAGTLPGLQESLVDPTVLEYEIDNTR